MESKVERRVDRSSTYDFYDARFLHNPSLKLVRAKFSESIEEVKRAIEEYRRLNGPETKFIITFSETKMEYGENGHFVHEAVEKTVEVY